MVKIPYVYSKFIMALNILVEPVKFLLSKRFPRVLDKQNSKKQYIYGLKKCKMCHNLLRNIEKKKYRSLLSFRTNLLVNNNCKFVANSRIPQAKYSSDSNKCSENSNPGRHKYHVDTENIINKQITAEFNAAFSYLSMACYFGRTEVSLAGCQGFFMHMYEEELEHAMIFINFQLMRGARVVLTPINVPESHDWKSIIKVFTVAVEMEKLIKEKLSAVFDVAERHKDLQLMDLISTQFMEEQNRSICELARLLTKAKMTDNPTGEYLFDKLLYNSFVKKSKDNLMYVSKVESKEDQIYK